MIVVSVTYLGNGLAAFSIPPCLDVLSSCAPCDSVCRVVLIAQLLAGATPWSAIFTHFSTRY